MRSKVCDDGKARILAKVVVPMGALEIATFALSNPQFFDDEEAMNTFTNLNKRQLFNVAKEAVAFRGADVEKAADVVRSNWNAKQIARAREHVDMLFPEVD